MKSVGRAKDLISKIKHWGLKGCFDFVIGYYPRKVRARKLRRFFWDNAKHYPLKATRGITLIGEFSRQGSLNKVIRDLAYSLKDAGVPFQTLDLATQSNIPISDLVGILTPKQDFRLLKYSKIITLVDNPIPVELKLDVSTIFFWEFDSGVQRGYPGLVTLPSVIGMSDFNATNFRRERGSGRKVFKLLYPFRFEATDPELGRVMRGRYGLTDSDFVVFFNFDLGSSRNRKNPDGALRAFAQAFEKDTSAYLIFKVQGSRTYPEKLNELKDLARRLGIGDRFIVETSYLPQAELYGLTMACDVYLSLHRGEGFGLGIAEAMSLGKPVIVTNYSSPTEFCDETNAILVPYRLVKPPAGMIDHAYYVDVREWAEPDIEQAASALHRLRNDAELRNQLGERARRSIREQFSTAAFRQSIDAFLEA